MAVVTKRRLITIETRIDAQRRFWRSGAQFRAYIGGVGSGKTYAGCAEVVRQPASTGMVVAPTYPMLRDATLRTFIEMLRPLIAEFNRSEMRITLTNGTTVLFRSADEPDRLRGPNLGWFYLDEAAMMHPDTWLIMIGRLREQPARAWITSTPRGKNWLWETFMQGNASYDIVKGSSRDNPYNPPEFVRSLEQAYTAEWLQQEVEGEFIDPSGALFRREWFTTVDQALDGLRWARYWDLAASTKSSADYTASAACALGADGTLYIRDMIRGRWEWPDAKKIILQTMLGEPDVIHAVEEAMHGLAALQELYREPELARVAFSGQRVDKDKLSRALPWASRAGQGKVKLVRGAWIPAFLDEVCMFPSGPHDDQVDSISGAMPMLGSEVSIRWL